jgi:hypothetical protein
MTDVQTCFTTLKRAVQVAQMPANSDLAQLQMSQPTNRYDSHISLSAVNRLPAVRTL